ncbi:MAG TPA: metalloregulator ArsR/SmtB family transcription factor [Longimicrobiales bacterium]|nr:metalloregulator ArsR/SmtB family transcription factor [Longimicrobiales bacterium]
MPDVFTALADPTRRWILERLHREGPHSVTELAAPLAMTRQAVSKHLGVLEGAGLLEREPRGRERLIRARREPLDEVTAWVEACSAAWDERLRRLEAYLDDDSEEEGSHV